jgi:hypothetical protein
MTSPEHANATTENVLHKRRFIQRLTSQDYLCSNELNYDNAAAIGLPAADWTGHFAGFSGVVKTGTEKHVEQDILLAFHVCPFSRASE